MSHDSLSDFVQATAAGFGIPGVAAGVWADGQEVYACHGVTSVDNPRRDLTNIAVGASDSVTAEGQVCYRIVAFNESGDSPASNTACVTAVAAPSNLTATPVDDSTIALVWTDNSVLEDGYEVVRAANGQWGSQVQATLSRNATSYRDTRLTQGTYQYGVRAKKMTGYNGEFFYSDLAPTGPVILALAPPTMTGIRVWATGSHAAYVDWSAQGIAAGFRVARSADSGSSWVTVATQVGSTSTRASSIPNVSATFWSCRCASWNGFSRR